MSKFSNRDWWDSAEVILPKGDDSDDETEDGEDRLRQERDEYLERIKNEVEKEGQ